MIFFFWGIKEQPGLGPLSVSCLRQLQATVKTVSSLSVNVEASAFAWGMVLL